MVVECIYKGKKMHLAVGVLYLREKPRRWIQENLHCPIRKAEPLKHVGSISLLWTREGELSARTKIIMERDSRVSTNPRVEIAWIFCKADYFICLRKALYP